MCTHTSITPANPLHRHTHTNPRRPPSDPSAPAPDEPLYLLDLLALRWHKLGPAPSSPPSLPTVVDSSPLRHNLTPEAIARGAARVEPRMRHTAVVRREGRPPAAVLAAAEVGQCVPFFV